MSAWQRRVAIALIDGCTVLIPREHKEWADAMRAELEAADADGEALSFALGCLWASVKERVLRIEFAAKVLRIGIPAGLSVLALLAAYLSGRHAEGAPETASVFGVSSAIFAMAATLFLTYGTIALARIAGALVPVYLALFVFAQFYGKPIADFASLSLYRALALEGVAIWSALLLMTVFLARSSATTAQHSGKHRL